MVFRYPPISSLRAFEAASRHLNYTRAAEELYITQSAISHQIKHMEELWGIKLFERQGRNIILSNYGKKVLPIIRDFLVNIENCVSNIQNEGSDNKVVRVQLSQSFALKWLVPKLGEFSLEHSDIDVWITTTDEPLPQSSDIDICISYMKEPLENFFCIQLLQEYCFPVCSHAFYNQHKHDLVEPIDLLDLTLLRRIDNDSSPRWKSWFNEAAGIQEFTLRKGIHYPDTSMAIQAALDNQGIALGRSAHIADDLTHHRLIKLFNISLVSDHKFFLLCDEKKLENQSVLEFLAWIKDKAQDSQQLFDKHAGITK